MADSGRYVYTGNVHDPEGQGTWRHACGQLLIERDWYVLGERNLEPDGTCQHCGTPCAEVFEAVAGLVADPAGFSHGSGARDSPPNIAFAGETNVPTYDYRSQE